MGICILLCMDIRIYDLYIYAVESKSTYHGTFLNGPFKEVVVIRSLNIITIGDRLEPK